MSAGAPQNRPGMRLDLCRWNRTGLGRFQYVDGDAAVWLEELRIALLGLYLREQPAEDRVPEKWRDLFMKATSEWPGAAERDRFARAVSWERLLSAFPARSEIAGKRNQRLLAQYDEQSSDYAWEILRAFARATHVLLGHSNAYANEAYLRTATQWDNIRRLAAMVNYQPTPPASAVASVALLLDAEKPAVEIERGLAMKYTPPQGGAPLVFENLRPLQADPALNALRVAGWDYDANELKLDVTSEWLAPGEAELPVGGLALLSSRGDADEDDVVTFASVARDPARGTAVLTFEGLDPAIGPRVKGDTVLRSEPADIRIGLPKTTIGIGSATVEALVLKLDSAPNYSVGAVVRVTPGGGTPFLAVVLKTRDKYLYLRSTETPGGTVTVEAFSPFAETGGEFVTPFAITRLYFRSTLPAGSPVVGKDSTSQGEEESSQIYDARPPNTAGYGYAPSADAKLEGAAVVPWNPPEVVPGAGSEPLRTVRFAGEPPKGLQAGDRFVARTVGAAQSVPLAVEGVLLESGQYYVQFDRAPPADHDLTEFIGPLRRTLEPYRHDRDPDDAIVGSVAVFEEFPPEQAASAALLKPGREVIVEYRDGEARDAALARITAFEHTGAEYRVTLESDRDFAGWAAGHTVFHGNVVAISHGETGGEKVLGSGDAEKPRQAFRLNVGRVSFVPSSAASSGVVPDIDVSVDGVRWEYRDYEDPTADGSDAYSVTLNEDDTLQIRFRRRLPTGSNNVAVTRHRVGVGAEGSGVPPYSFVKPMKKHRFVTAIVQPFATAGGADREPVGDIRVNAPAKLAANDRAVSLQDFERLCRRHSSIWQARARQVNAPGSVAVVEVTVVPANGGLVNATLEADLVEFVRARALPGTRVYLRDYETIAIAMEVSVLVDFDRYDKTTVKESAHAALAAAFALPRRALGQPFYIAEILAEVETVAGVSAALVDRFARRDPQPEPLRDALTGGSLSAVFPRDEQVAVVVDGADIVVRVKPAEVLS